MNYSFISIVSIVVPDPDIINGFLRNVHKILKENFSDFEIILINNKALKDVSQTTMELEQDIKKDITVINLSSNVFDDNAIFAGFDRANGDYTIFFEMKFFRFPELILQLFMQAQQNWDIVYIKHKKRNISLKDKLLFHTYYWIFNLISDFKIDVNTDKTRIISRRALNSLLRLRDSIQYFKGIFYYLGYNSSYIEIKIPDKEQREKRKNQFKIALQTYLAFTNILNKLLLGILFISIAFSLGISLDAILLKYRGSDLFGIVHHNTIPGWSFLIVTLSVMFTLICLILYLMSVYLSQISKETKHRPLYLIESIQRL